MMRTALQKLTASRIPEAILLLGGAVILFSFLARYFQASLGHDQASYLIEAQRFLHGAEPYGPRLAETNPPMIVWFSALPVLLARGAQADEMGYFKLLIVAMIFGSITWSLALLRRGSIVVHPAAMVLFGGALLEIQFFVDAYDFGQREHLFIILLLPYLLGVSTGAVQKLSTAERCALGVAAALAIWFKPQQTLVLVPLEIVAAFRTRMLHRLLAPEFLSLVFASGFILALVRLTTPLYFTGTMPLLLNTYWALGTDSFSALLQGLHHYAAIVLALLAACLLLRRYQRNPAATIALLLCSVAAAIAYAVQHTQWLYHKYPYQQLLLLALVYFAFDLAQPWASRLLADAALARKIGLTASAMMVLVLAVVALHPRNAFPRAIPPPDDPLDRYFARYAPSTTVYVFSTDVLPMGIAYNHDLQWGSRFAHLWMMPSIVQNELGPAGGGAPFKRLPPETLGRLASLQRTQSTEDLNYWKPFVVLVQRCSVQTPCQAMGAKNFDMLSWFLKSPDFAAAWSHYGKRPPVGNYDAYALIP